MAQPNSTANLVPFPPSR